MNIVLVAKRDCRRIPSLLQIPKFGCKIFKAPPLILAYKHRRFKNFSLEF